jgi:hypothetical protein
MTSFVAIGRLIGGSETWTTTRFVYRARLAVVLLALGLPLSTAPHARSSISVPGNLSVFPSDVLVAAAVVLWLAERLFSRQRDSSVSSPLLPWPLLVFGLSLVPGVIRGHERYGESLVGQPVRLVLYAAIAFAVLRLRPRDVYWGIVVVLYAGTVWQLVLAGYSLATGSHRTGAYLLSTGGTRILSLGVGMYLAAALLIALLNVGFDRGRRRWLHLAMAGLALVAEALTFGRTTYVALALMIPVVVFALRETRSFVLSKWPVWVAFALVFVAAAALTPSVGSTLVDRVTANPLNDSTVRWRIGSFGATLSGFKSGQWQQVEPPDGLNRLSDSSFEQGVGDWLMQGGTRSSIPVNFPTFDRHALRIETDGTAFDEGPYSKPILTHVGQTWKFGVWLRGAQGGELVNVGIWEYRTDGSHTGYANLPVVLGTQMSYHSVELTVTDPETAYIRAIIRTRSDPQKAVYYADETYVVSMPAPKPADPAQNVLANGGFERGTSGWLMQGGQFIWVKAPSPGLGRLSGRMTTLGDAVDEGFYSDAVPARRGDDWTFSIWLKGATGQEVVGVELWEYDAQGETAHQTVAPFVLSDTMQRYFVHARVVRSNTTQIRALVRTWGMPQEIEVVADRASLTKDDPSQAGARQGASAAGSDNGWPGENALLGLGFGRTFNYIWNGAGYQSQGDPHNSYIWILAGGGVLALACVLTLMGIYLWDAVRRIRAAVSFERALVLWAVGTWFVFMVNALTGPILTDPSFLLTIWVVMLLPALVGGRRPTREFH